MCVCTASKIFAPTSASLLVEPNFSDEWEADLVVKEVGGEGSRLLHSFPYQVNIRFSSVQFSSVTQSCPALCDPINCSTPGLPVNHHLPEFTQTHAHRVSDAIQPSHPLSHLLLLPSISQGELNQGWHTILPLMRGPINWYCLSELLCHEGLWSWVLAQQKNMTWSINNVFLEKK